MLKVLQNLKTEQWAGLLLVLALHAAALYGLWSARLIPAPEEVATVFVNFIDPTPPPPKPKEPPRPKPPVPVKLDKPRPVEPPHYHLVAEAPIVSPTEPVAPPPPPEPPVIAPPAPPAPPPQPAGPVNLSSELSVSCPVRPAPAYPALSKKMGEEGKVVLRVELDEAGRFATVRVVSSSGFSRLDEAALTAVKNWHCNPAQRNGQPVRAVALQPFNFILEGH
ncbi:MAG: energy transducer TonB [Thiobacillaceae bacterium]